MKQEEQRIPWWKRKFYVHPIQRKYFALSLIPLVICTLLLILLLFVPLKLTLLSLDFGPEKSAIINNIYPLVSLIWPAAVISMLVYAVVFYFVTHGLIGPLPRLEAIFRKIAEGDLIHRSIRVRPKDDLKEFVGLMDGAFGTLISALTTIRNQEGLAVRELAALQERIREGLNDAGQILQTIEGTIARQKEMEKVLAYFKFPDQSGAESGQLR
jgi:methyl-accepting chemotaxis protein